MVVAMAVLAVLWLMPPSPCADAGDPDGPWGTPVRVDSGPRADRGINSVRLELGPEGTLYSAWLEDRGDGNDCFVSASTDGGDSWARDVRVDPYPNSARSYPTTCDVEVDGDGYVYAAYTQRLVQGWRVRFARSDDGAESFRSPSNAYDVVNTSWKQEHVAMAVSPTGQLYILFTESTPDSSRLLLVLSSDGLNPQPPAAVERDQPASVAHVQGDIAFDGDGTMYIAYGYREVGEAGIKLARRAPSSSDFTITKVHTVQEAEPRQLRPTLAVSPEGMVEIAFDPGEADGRLVHVRSDDGGEHFTQPSVIWAGGPATWQADPDLVFDGLGRINVAWSEGGPGPGRVLHSLSQDGLSFTAATEVNGDWNSSEMGPRVWEGHPAIAALEDGSVAVAFASRLNNSVGVYMSKLVNEPPVVEITLPAPGAVVRGDVLVLGTARDVRGTTGLARVYVRVADGDPVRLPGTTEWEHEFDSTELPDGLVNITAWASDGFLTGPEARVRVDVDNNLPPTFTIGCPANGTVHTGKVRVAGAAHDGEGFEPDHKLQYSLNGVNWTTVTGGTLLDDNNLDYEVSLDLSDHESGDVQIWVRVSDGDKFAEPRDITVELVNRADLELTATSVSWEPEHPQHGQLVIFTVHVENVGTVKTEPYELELVRGSQVEAMVKGSDLGPGESENLVVEWNAHAGQYRLKFVLDSRFLIDELDETNNEVLVGVDIPRPPEEEDGDGVAVLPIVIVVIIIVLVMVVVVFIRWKVMTAPEEVVETYVDDGEGMYGEEAPRGDAGQPPGGTGGRHREPPVP